MSKKQVKKILPSAKETKTAKKAWVAPNYKSKTGGKVIRKIKVFTNQKDHFKKDKGLESKGFATRALHAQARRAAGPRSAPRPSGPAARRST